MKPAHLIFKLETDVTSKTLFKPKAVYASTIKPGDYVYTQTSGGGFPIADKVVAVALGEVRGAFAPVTSEGTLFVDGVFASCFADLGDHDLAHSLMSPFRAIYGLAPNSVGAGGHYLHKYLKTIIRPIGLRVLGEDQFYKGLFQEQKNKTMADWTKTTNQCAWELEFHGKPSFYTPLLVNANFFLKIKIQIFKGSNLFIRYFLWYSIFSFSHCFQVSLLTIM